MKISATVILYNPDEDVFNNVMSYARSVEHIIIVDNSTKHNVSLISKLQNELANVIYLNNNNNLGIASALNIGCDKALELGSDWVLTMDQDSSFINFEHYVNCLHNLSCNKDIALLAGNTVRNAITHLPANPTCHYEEKFLVITSGNFLNLSLFNKIGRFEEKLFIDMVDHEYCMKVNQHKYKIYYLKDVLIEHNLGELFQRRNLLTGKIRNKIEHSPQRVYYITRNFFYTWKMYSKDFPKEFNLLKTINILFIHEMTKILIYEDQKLKKIGAKFLGLYHFFIGKYGKYDI